MGKPVVVVVGAGPGVSGSVARLFAGKGYDVGLVGVHEPALAELREAITRFAGHAGHLDVLHFNPSAFRQQDPLALTPDDLLADVRLGVGALLTAVQAARPYMSAGARITATGSMAADKPWHEAASLGVQKAGLRNLVRSIDATLKPDGIRAVSVTVNGTLGAGTAFDPDLVADAIFAAARQDEAGWQVELPYDG